MPANQETASRRKRQAESPFSSPRISAEKLREVIARYDDILNHEPSNSRALTELAEANILCGAAYARDGAEKGRVPQRNPPGRAGDDRQSGVSREWVLAQDPRATGSAYRWNVYLQRDARAMLDEIEQYF